MAGIYIHIPFCKQACYYCDFHFSTSLKKKGDLLWALKKELQRRKKDLQDQTVETIYFGGGTPSLLTVQELKGLIDEVYRNFKVASHPEITLEANPDDLVSEKAQPETTVKAYKEIGINRLSIGIQSFFEDDLKSMNRAHTANEAKRCLETATKHFNNITIDLIYGIPNMSLEKWQNNLQQAFAFGINHISSYALTVEPKTALERFIKKGDYPPINDALAQEHFNCLVAATQEQGFVHYEISNFGKPNYFSKHNTSYWQGKPYLGIGPSAHSFSGQVRSWNVANNTKYIKGLMAGKLPRTVETLSVADRYNEYVMTGLRTIWGISLNKVTQDFGETFKEHLLHEAEVFMQQDLLAIALQDSHVAKDHAERLVITEKGKFLADGIASQLFYIN
ncbi:coproporphyrinogen III oxidase [Mangrovimonas yunxiaonensis]|uniref:Heme chaperone HemW n=1 Tax=Mangrovimonas yunxiaonensis TaxID=1197477 RepID=A0A084TLK6_9FLAO|nr:radical SAM family heme chaperone HemW [Mangrovimonas yunxiaonensis]KFB01592.1 coproporphyrinogen III oxidase [Mangrovimonas yunxiaonensis]GGH35772.1 coproporphyrinogen III oxidase [Mangrovimonas yunxiaonensis]